jgi:hypothetical protein
MNDYIEENNNKLQYDSFTGTYFLHDEEWEEPMEFTEDELVQEGIYISMNKEYNMTLGLTREEVSSILNGESVKFDFLNDDNIPAISVAIKTMEDDLPLGDYMDLSEKLDEELSNIVDKSPVHV